MIVLWDFGSIFRGQFRLELGRTYKMKFLQNRNSPNFRLLSQSAQFRVFEQILNFVNVLCFIRCMKVDFLYNNFSYGPNLIRDYQQIIFVTVINGFYLISKPTNPSPTPSHQFFYFLLFYFQLLHQQISFFATFQNFIQHFLKKICHEFSFFNGFIQTRYLLNDKHDESFLLILPKDKKCCLSASIRYCKMRSGRKDKSFWFLPFLPPKIGLVGW